MNILIVDDEIDSCRILSQYLKRFGECDLVLDGREALKSVKRSFRERQPYDLICLDICMPNMDGQKALAKIREIEESEGIRVTGRAKVLMTSALSDSNSILTSFLKQCDGYLVKPITRKNLMAKLREIELV